MCCSGIAPIGSLCDMQYLQLCIHMAIAHAVMQALDRAGSHVAVAKIYNKTGYCPRQ